MSVTADWQLRLCFTTECRTVGPVAWPPEFTKLYPFQVYILESHLPQSNQLTYLRNLTSNPHARKLSRCFSENRTPAETDTNHPPNRRQIIQRLDAFEVFRVIPTHLPIYQTGHFNTCIFSTLNHDVDQAHIAMDEQGLSVLRREGLVAEEYTVDWLSVACRI